MFVSLCVSSFVCSFVRLFVRSFVHSFVCLFACLFVCLFCVWFWKESDNVNESESGDAMGLTSFFFVRYSSASSSVTLTKLSPNISLPTRTTG